MRLFLLFLMMLSAISASAQTNNSKETAKKQSTEKVGEATASTGVQATTAHGISITLHGDAETILKKNLRGGSKKVKAYRIQIFSGNTPSAREEAGAELARFKQLFPGYAARMIYENPYFKVTVGNYRTMEQAQTQLKRISKHFSIAFIVHESVYPRELLK
jgi:hypothetical protein